MPAQRGIEASYETVRCWTLKFGQVFAQNRRRSRPKPAGRHARQQSSGELASGHSATGAKTTEVQVSTFSVTVPRGSRLRPQQLQRSKPDNTDEPDFSHLCVCRERPSVAPERRAHQHPRHLRARATGRRLGMSLRVRWHRRRGLSHTDAKRISQTVVDASRPSVVVGVVRRRPGRVSIRPDLRQISGSAATCRLVQNIPGNLRS